MKTKSAKKQKIIIFYIQPKSGHFAAAEALKQTFSSNHPEIEVEVLNFMEYVNPVLANLILKTYKNVIKRSPDTWKYLYDNPKVLKKTEKLRNLLIRVNLTRIRKLITELKPSAIICTQAIPCSVLAYYKKKKHVSIPLIGTITDFTTHSYWLHDQVDYYMVPSEREKWRLLSKGVNLNKINVSGIPIDPKFKNDLDKNTLKEKFELEKFKFTLLVMGGSQGLGNLKKTVNRMSKIRIPFQMLIVAGTNKHLLKTITKKLNRGKYPKNIKVFSHVNYIDELMEVSDAILTKPGGLTTSEALAKNCPLLLINPIPGQESQNCEYLTSAKAAIKVENEDKLIPILTELLQNPEELNELSFQTQMLKKPSAAENIAKFVVNI